MSLRVSCPYCNAIVPVEANDRTLCPRCGEAFNPVTAEHLPDETPVLGQTQPSAKTGFLYSRTAVLLSLGLATAILGVGMAVIRPWEPRTAPRQESKLPVVVSPLGLSGLVYLPPRTNIVAAVQPLPLLAYAAQTKTDPRKFLTESGVPDAVFAKLNQAGVPLDQIDHLVAGLFVSSESGRLIPGLTACLKLTRPVADESKFLTQLKAEKNSSESKGGRTVYTVQLGLPLPPLLTRVDDLTYLLTFTAEDSALLDKPMPPGGGHLSKELREAMTTKVSPAAFAWLATDAEQWVEKDLVKIVGAATPGNKEWLAKFSSFRALAGGLSLEPDPQLRLGIRTVDSTATNAVQNQFKKQFTVEGAVIGNDQEWATVQTPFDPKSSGLKSLFVEWLGGKP